MTNLLPKIERFVTVYSKCSKIPPSASMHFATRVQRSLVALWIFEILFWTTTNLNLIERTNKMTEPSQRPATKNVCKTRRLQLQFLSSWWWTVCRPKHVEQLKNIGIINSTTWSHLVGSFYDIPKSLSTLKIAISYVWRRICSFQFSLTL